MRKYGKIKVAAKVLSAALAFAFVMTNVTTAYAADSEVEVQGVISESTEAAPSETDAGQVLEEKYIPAEEDNTYDRVEYANPDGEYIMPLLDENTFAPFEWVVSPGTRHLSEKIYLIPGQSLSMSCTAAPGGTVYWIGIMNSHGDIRYVEGTDGFGHCFSIYEADNYRAFVQNRDKVTITAVGTYCYHTP